MLMKSPKDHAFLIEPVYSASRESKLVGFLLGVSAFENIMDNVVQKGLTG
jgi:hypothetical protein